MKKTVIAGFLVFFAFLAFSESHAALPDITIGSITVQASRQSGKITLNVTPQIKNVSSSPINRAFNVRMVPYRRHPSTNTPWFADLTKAYNITIRKMAPNETKEITFHLELGSRLGWEWKFKIIADVGNGIRESNEGNNEKFSGAFQSTDLHRVEVVSLSMEPQEARANQDRPTFVITLKNMGAQDTQAKITILQPCDRTGRGVIYVYGGIPSFNLRPGMNTIRYIPCGSARFLGPEAMARYHIQEYGVCVQIEFPDAGKRWTPNYWTQVCEVSNRPGYYRLGGICSADGSPQALSNIHDVHPVGQEPKEVEKFIPEEGTIVTPMRPALPDLAVTDIRLVRGCLIQATIKNTGRVQLPERAYRASVQMFNNNRPWGGIILKGLDPQRRLKNPGATVTFLWFPRAANLRLSPGRHVLKLVVDYHNILRESNERNNTMVRELTCRPRIPRAPGDSRPRLP